MSSFFSQLQNIPGTWWQMAKIPAWPSAFANFLGEYYRREDEGIQRLNELLELATQVRRNFLSGIMQTIQPVRPPVEKQPQPAPPASKDCQLPGG